MNWNGLAMRGLEEDEWVADDEVLIKLILFGF